MSQLVVFQVQGLQAGQPVEEVNRHTTQVVVVQVQGLQAGQPVEEHLRKGGEVIVVQVQGLQAGRVFEDLPWQPLGEVAVFQVQMFQAGHSGEGVLMEREIVVPQVEVFQVGQPGEGVGLHLPHGTGAQVQGFQAGQVIQGLGGHLRKSVAMADIDCCPVLEVTVGPIGLPFALPAFGHRVPISVTIICRGRPSKEPELSTYYVAIDIESGTDG